MVNDTCPDDIGGAGLRIDIPDGADQSVLVGPAELLDLDDALGRTGERVTAQQHRHRAGMAGHAGEACREPRRARDRGDYSDREIKTFQHRTLLDVQFDIGQQFAAHPCRRADTIGSSPNFCSAHRASRGPRRPT